MFSQRQFRRFLVDLIRGLFLGPLFGGVILGLNFFLRSGGGTPLLLSFTLVVLTGYRSGKFWARFPEAMVSALCIAGGILMATVQVLRLQSYGVVDVLMMVMAMVAALTMGYCIVRGGENAAHTGRLKS